MSIFKRNLKKISVDSEKFLKNFLKRQSDNSKLITSMKYGLFSGGKNFRTSIVVNTGKIFKVNYKKLIIIGAAVECIHSYSLIHDDLPCMDDDEIRRGKMTTHKKFGESTAVLSGNSLLTLAFEILSSRQLKVKNNLKINLIKSLAISSGHLGMAGGQFLDLFFEHKKISKNSIINMQCMKTGMLFGFCCEAAAIVANLSNSDRNKFYEIGKEIGIIYQIADDFIDLTGNKKIVGKPTQKDNKMGKSTLLNFAGKDYANSYAQNLKKKIINKLKKYGKNSNDLIQSIEFILNRKK